MRGLGSLMIGRDVGRGVNRRVTHAVGFGLHPRAMFAAITK